MPPSPAEVRLQHDAGEFAGRGRDPKRHVAFIPHATSRPALPKLVRFVTGFVFFNTAQGTAEVRFQHDAGEFLSHGRDLKCHVAFILHATSRPAVLVSDGHYQNWSDSLQGSFS